MILYIRRGKETEQREYLCNTEQEEEEEYLNGRGRGRGGDIHQVNSITSTPTTWTVSLHSFAKQFPSTRNELNA